jgi:hypothetical protein
VVRHVPFDRGVTLLGRSQTVSLVRASGLRVTASRYYFFFPRMLAVLRGAERHLGWFPLGAQYVVGGER